MRIRAAAALFIGSAVAALAQSAPPPPAAPATPSIHPKRSTPKPKRPAAPLDFSGIWVIDEAASQGVSPAMHGAVLSVRQNGNHIWIEPIERKEPAIMSEEVVVDGRAYEKGLGPMKGRKGTLVADWGKDGTSLWLQVNVSEEGNDNAGMQRAIWRLREGGAVWTRQTRTITKEDVKDTFLVFRKRGADKKN